jgi:hypothetical protein
VKRVKKEIAGDVIMKNYFSCLGFVFETLLSCSFLFAQPCLSLKPAPACRSSFITEFGYSYKITPHAKWERTGHHYVTSELGYIYNLNAKYGLGFTHFTGWEGDLADWGGDHNLRGGLKLRLRKWLNPKTSFDLSGGKILWDIDHSDFKRSTFIGGASLNFSEWQAVNVLIEVLETKSYDYSDSYFNGVHSPRRRNVSIYLGYKLSSKPGLALNGLTVATIGVTYAILYAIFSSCDGDCFNFWGE